MILTMVMLIIFGGGASLGVTSALAGLRGRNPAPANPYAFYPSYMTMSERNQAEFRKKYDAIMPKP